MALCRSHLTFPSQAIILLEEHTILTPYNTKHTSTCVKWLLCGDYCLLHVKTSRIKSIDQKSHIKLTVHFPREERAREERHIYYKWALSFAYVSAIFLFCFCFSFLSLWIFSISKRFQRPWPCLGWINIIVLFCCVTQYRFSYFDLMHYWHFSRPQFLCYLHLCVHTFMQNHLTDPKNWLPRVSWGKMLPVFR